MPHAVITGVARGSGIGRAILRAVLRECWDITAIDMSLPEELTTSTPSRADDETGPIRIPSLLPSEADRVFYCLADVCISEEVVAALKGGVERFGQVSRFSPSLCPC